MSGSIITIFIHFLYENLKKNKMSDMLAFVDPSIVGAIGCSNARERSRALATRFMNATEGQYFLIPYNDVKMYKKSVEKVARKKIIWENMAEVPLEIGSGTVTSLSCLS